MSQVYFWKLLPKASRSPLSMSFTLFEIRHFDDVQMPFPPFHAAVRQD